MGPRVVEAVKTPKVGPKAFKIVGQHVSTFSKSFQRSSVEMPRESKLGSRKRNGRIVKSGRRINVVFRFVHIFIVQMTTTMHHPSILVAAIFRHSKLHDLAQNDLLAAGALPTQAKIQKLFGKTDIVC